MNTELDKKTTTSRNPWTTEITIIDKTGHCDTHLCIEPQPTYRTVGRTALGTTMEMNGTKAGFIVIRTGSCASFTERLDNPESINSVARALTPAGKRKIEKAEEEFRKAQKALKAAKLEAFECAKPIPAKVIAKHRKEGE